MESGNRTSGKNAHKISSFMLVLLAVFAAGYQLGLERSPSYLDATVIERRLREVFCEQALHTKLLKRCDPTFPRSYLP
jgi:hypothetical protein